MTLTARSGLKQTYRYSASNLEKFGRNDSYSPFGIETDQWKDLKLAAAPGRNDSYSPFGIETSPVH
jgi:hypothetical protein